MVATDDYREGASLHGSTRDAVRQNFYTADIMQNSGDVRLGLPSLNRVDTFESVHSWDLEASHPQLATISLQDKEWMIIDPIPPRALVTSLPPSPTEVSSDKFFKPVKGAMNSSKAIKHLNEIANKTGSQSTPKSCQNSLSNISLDSKTTVYKEQFDTFSSQQPENPSIKPSVQAVRPSSNPVISEDDLKLLLKLRHRVQLLRLQIQGQRGVVELKREILSDADEQYIKRIRTNHVIRDISEQIKHSEALVLEDLWRLSQKARDEFGPAQDSLISMESRLEAEEVRLERVEERFYKSLESTYPASQIRSLLDVENETTSENETPSEHESNEESCDSSSTISKVLHDGDYDDYLWRLGNLDLLQERHQDLFNEKSMLEDEQEKRRKVGIDLGTEGLDFIRRFGEIIAPVELEIEEVSRDVERLKAICVRKGVIDNEGNLIRVLTNDEGSGYESQGKEQPIRRAEQSKLSQERGPSGNNEVEFRDSISNWGFGPFINLWLLHRLRTSALEFLLLAYYVALAVGDLDGLDWKAEAIKLWNKDGAGGARPDQPLTSPGSHETSMLQVSTKTGYGIEDYVVIVRKAQSSNVVISTASFNVESFAKSKAKSAS